MTSRSEQPRRIQLRRTKGWRMPENTVKADRSTTLGNPFTVAGCREAGFQGTDREIARRCVGAFDAWIDTPYWRNNWQGPESEKTRSAMLEAIPGLRGKNLACWCQLCPEHAGGKPFDVECEACAPCHVDVLGRIANREESRS